MAESVCVYCNGTRRGRMTCVRRTYRIAGKRYKAVEREKLGRCPECNADYLGLHHHDCSHEPCPACGRAARHCRCVREAVALETMAT